TVWNGGSLAAQRPTDHLHWKPTGAWGSLFYSEHRQWQATSCDSGRNCFLSGLPRWEVDCRKQWRGRSPAISDRRRRGASHSGFTARGELWMDCGRALPVCLPVETVADQDLPIEHFEWTKTALQRDNAPGAVGKLRHRSCSFQLRRAILRLRLRSAAFRTLYDQRAEVGILCSPTRRHLDSHICILFGLTIAGHSPFSRLPLQIR